MFRMKTAVILVSLLVLGWTWTPQGVPIPLDPVHSTQENFNLAQFLGTWYHIARATNCSKAEHHGKGRIEKVELEEGLGMDEVKMKRTIVRQGMCKETFGEYEMTATPGRFFYHMEMLGADIDIYVTDTNYDEYAIVIMRRQNSSTYISTCVNLYSRTRDVPQTVTHKFLNVVREQRLDNAILITNKNEGDCVPGEPVAGNVAEEHHHQRMRRSLLSPDDEGSGDDLSLFQGTEACKEAPDAGPCFGMKQRYYYNSTSMTCTLFSYGGCMGNQNNFETERECLQRCRTEAVCRLPMVANPCVTQTPTWSFDSTSGLCVLYKQGFCSDNANKFYTKSECEEYCGITGDGEE